MTMRPAYRQYLKSFVPAMLAYVAILFGSIYGLRSLGDSAALYLRVALALAPVIPILFVCRALMRFVRDSDELERKIELEAVAISSFITGIVFMSMGFLIGAHVLFITGETVAIWVLPSLFGFYGIGKCLAIRRYR